MQCLMAQMCHGFKCSSSCEVEYAAMCQLRNRVSILVTECVSLAPSDKGLWSTSAHSDRGVGCIEGPLVFCSHSSQLRQVSWPGIYV